MSNDGRQYGSIYRAALKECEARLEARDRYVDELKAENARLRSDLVSLRPYVTKYGEDTYLVPALACPRQSQGSQYGEVDEALEALKRVRSMIEECEIGDSEFGDTEENIEVQSQLVDIDYVIEPLIRRHIERAVPDAVRQLPEKWFRRADDNALPYSDDRREQLRTDAGELRHEIHKSLASAPASEAVPDGWKLVPVEATESMKEAGQGCNLLVGDDPMGDAYRAMLAAAPSSQHEQGE